MDTAGLDGTGFRAVITALTDPAMQTSILLIVVDSLRADRLGCYGYARDTSPNLDRLAHSGVLAENLFCPAIPTYPSLTTLHTGQLPTTHGIVAHGGDAAVDPDAPFLPEQLMEAGYATCLISNAARGRPWFGRGYEYIIDPSMRKALDITVTCEELNARAIPWLRSHVDEPFFLCIHYWDPHWPYVPPPSTLEIPYEGNPTDPERKDLEPYWKFPVGQMARHSWLCTPDGPVTDPVYVEMLYDQEVRYVDQGIGALLSALEAAHLTERTLVIVTSDHGESMTEHGIFFDHYGLYDCTIRVPLIASWPRHLPAGRRLDALLQISDLAPTILKAVDRPKPLSMDGQCFWELLCGHADFEGHEEIVSTEATWQAKWSLRTKTHKLILAREEDFLGNPLRELYDLTADPKECVNLAHSMPGLAAELEQRLESLIQCRLQAAGRDEDPLKAEGAVMARIWKSRKAGPLWRNEGD